MGSAISDTLPKLEHLRKTIKSNKGAQVSSRAAREEMHSFASVYFSDVRRHFASIEGIDKELSETDAIFQSLLSLSRKNPSREKCVRLLKDIKTLFVRMEAATFSSAPKAAAVERLATDNLIIESLREICPTAALAYDQALRDLISKDRLSYRGPATDLREALRETLDTLAPDSDVIVMPGYKPEQDAKHPTMKQKVRYILKNRGFKGGQLEAPESAVEGIESIVGAMVRSVYTRSNISTHTSTERPEVMRLHAWVRLVLCELLEIPA